MAGLVHRGEVVRNDEGLADSEVERFVADGFVQLASAFPREVADAGRALLWAATGCNPDDPATWTQPVVRLPGFGDEPFRAAANTPRLRAAFDQLVGAGRWVPRAGLGTFPIRFPHPDDPGDDGVEFFALARRAVPASEHRPVVTATGAAGDVYLCHPFLVHAAQRHRSVRPKFMAQPPLDPVGELDLDRSPPVPGRTGGTARSGPDVSGPARVGPLTP